MSDSEMSTLALMMDYLPFPGETHDESGTSRNKFGVSSRQFIGFIRANYQEWFPNLLTQSQFNRRFGSNSHYENNYQYLENLMF